MKTPTKMQITNVNANCSVASYRVITWGGQGLFLSRMITLLTSWWDLLGSTRKSGRLIQDRMTSETSDKTAFGDHPVTSPNHNLGGVITYFQGSPNQLLSIPVQGNFSLMDMQAFYRVSGFAMVPFHSYIRLGLKHYCRDWQSCCIQSWCLQNLLQLSWSS